MVLTPVENHKIFAPEPEEKKNTPPPPLPTSQKSKGVFNKLWILYPTPFFVQDLTVIYDTNLNGYKINNTL